MSTSVTSDGVALHYPDEGSGQPVVLIAGFTASAETWQLQRCALLAAGHRVLDLDRRSHGASKRRLGRPVDALGRVPRMGDPRAPETRPLLEFLAGPA
jgi:pimeloyl-ACP methyl ester carboxylesterase